MVTKIQRRLLECLHEHNAPATNTEISNLYAVNNSDIIREGKFLSQEGYVTYVQTQFLELTPTEKAHEIENLPQYSVLTSLQENPDQLVSDLRAVIRPKYIGLAFSELKKKGLIEIYKVDSNTKVRYTPNGSEDIIEKQNKVFQACKNPLNIYDSDYDPLKVEFGRDEQMSLVLYLQKQKYIQLKDKSSYSLEINDEGRAIVNQEIENLETRLTPDMIRTGSWRDVQFREYDPELESVPLHTGRIHPMRQLARYVEQIFRDMGYEYMSGSLVADSFNNFDALFTPQDHPAREMQDTFFLEHPKYCGDIPEDILEKIKETHKNSFQYEWDERVAHQNILRTHTTAVTAQYLRDRDDIPLKLFSIGKVFRNEKIDAMHLPEFHQIEGVVVGDVNLRDLMGHITEFYTRIGLEDITFKKTFNPYTEPSMEIFAHHPGLDKMIEIGNSGMFRPEMLHQFGLGDHRAIAWGLALERLASIVYGVEKIKDLYGVQVPNNWIRGEKKLWL